MRIRVFLALMVTAIVLPLIVASSFAVYKIWQEERALAMSGLHKTVDTTSILVERDIQASIAALYALGNSEHLITANFEAFYAQAKAINRVPDTWTALLRSDGTAILNTALPFLALPQTAPLPAAAIPASQVSQVIATQKPLVSGVFTGPRTGRQIIAVYVPVLASGANNYVVVQGFALEHWKKINRQQNIPADWVVAVIDGAGKFIARSHKSDELRGKLARPELVAAAAQQKQGLIRHFTMDGIDSYDAFQRSELTGWTVAVAAPAASVNWPVVRALQIVVAGFLLAMLISGVLAFAFGRRIIEALQSASKAATLIGHGPIAPAKPTLIAEVDNLSQSMNEVSALLEQERLARLTAEQERTRLLEAERLARDVAQKENAAKDHFLAMLGHELRNPLAAISGAVTGLTRSTRSTLDADRYVGIIRRQNKHLVHIIDDLLDISRLIKGKIVLECRPVDLAQALQNCLDGLKAAERLEGHTLTVNAQSVWVHADPVRIEQVLINIIGNALKFSKAGTTIYITLEQIDSRAVLNVQDQGAGMTPELVSQVFDPFIQGPPPATGVQSGMGIGLALVKQLIELHGGTVAIRSDGLNQGSNFTVSLPMVSAPEREPTTGYGELISARPRTLLYVEDNADARSVMSEMLRLCGYEVREAADGAQALEALKSLRFDAILLDIGLPDMNGYELAGKIRALHGMHGLPIIALTGYGQTVNDKSADRASFNAHLVKPVNFEDLTRAIETAMDTAVEQSTP